jgi:hypothetical protein
VHSTTEKSTAFSKHPYCPKSAEMRDKSLLFSGRSRKKVDGEKLFRTSAIQRERWETDDLCRVWAKVASENTVKTMGTLRTQ